MTSSRQPISNIPSAVLAFLAILIGVQVARTLVSADTDTEILVRLAFIPIRFTASLDPGDAATQVAAWAASSDPTSAARTELGRYVLTAVHTPATPTLLSYALLHGGWTHLGLNGMWLLAFGTPTARRFGSLRFTALLASSAVAGALFHWALFRFATEPLIGASASVSGCMGAALRFAFQTAATEERQPALSLRATVADPRPRSFLLIWFLSNALFGIGSVSFGLSDQPVAWQAHIGGFLVGLLLFPLFDPTPVRPVGLEGEDA